MNLDQAHQLAIVPDTVFILQKSRHAQTRARAIADWKVAIMHEHLPSSIVIQLSEVAMLNKRCLATDHSSLTLAYNVLIHSIFKLRSIILQSHSFIAHSHSFPAYQDPLEKRLMAANNLNTSNTSIEHVVDRVATMSALSGDYEARKANQRAHRLSRKQSLRNLNLNFDSSDSVPSEFDSIYNAENILSNDLKSQMSGFSCIDSTPVSPRPVTSHFVDFTDSAESDFLASHSRWPASLLEPIIERRTGSEVRRCSSVPHLQPSPERLSRIIQSKVSARSVRPLESTPAAQNYNSWDDNKHFHSFSLNDLDCLPKSDTSRFLRQDWISSSSSEEALKIPRLCSFFPLKPAYPQPYRCPTPPGLPKFGTKEAQEYRLEPPSVPSRAMRFLRNLLRRPCHDDDPMSSNVILDTTSTSPRTQDMQPNDPVVMLRRALGASQPVSSPPRRGEGLRVPLPMSVRIAGTLGALTQAEDGSLVRGRWGPRFSGHSVGQRELNAHPLARVAGLHSIEEVIREIDKMCQAADEEDISRQVHNDSTSLQVSERPSENVVHALLSGIVGSQSDGIQAIERDSAVSADRQEAMNRSSVPDRQSIIGPALLLSSTSPAHATQQQAHGAGIPRDSSCKDNVAGFRDYVQQGEREQARRHLAQRKEEKSCISDCWEGFWLFCCCPADGRRSEGCHNV